MILSFISAAFDKDIIANAASGNGKVADTCPNVKR
jgi:hypothetical protein